MGLVVGLNRAPVGKLPFSLLATVNMLIWNIIVLLLENQYHVSSDYEYVKFVAHNLKVWHFLHIFNSRLKISHIIFRSVSNPISIYNYTFLAPTIR
jgi:hypothetical protein